MKSHAQLVVGSLRIAPHQPRRSTFERVIFLKSNNNIDFQFPSIFLVQLSTSSLAIHGGAIFSAVSGRKSIPISAIEAPEHGAWYRVHGFYLTTTFCLNPAQQAVSY